jgi:hypothetical protein
MDIDGTICTQDGANYSSAQPVKAMIDKANLLYGEGHIIIYFTARGSTTGVDWRPLTEKQLKSWGVKYQELIMGKPFGDYYIDDKSINLDTFLTLSVDEF